MSNDSSSEFEFVSGKDDPVQTKKKQTSSNCTTDADAPEGLFGWVKGPGGGLFSKVVKSSMETVITTLGMIILSTIRIAKIMNITISILCLDPQMKDYIHSGGNLRVIVASDNQEDVNAIKEAFHSIFGLATVYGIPTPPNKNVAVQPVGFAAAKSSVNEKLDSIRDTHPEAKEDGTILTGKIVFQMQSNPIFLPN